MALRDQEPRGELPAASTRRAPEREVAVRTVHVHRPRLDDEGYVEWDREAGLVHRGPRYEEVTPLLAALDDGVLDVGRDAP